MLAEHLHSHLFLFIVASLSVSRLRCRNVFFSQLFQLAHNTDSGRKVDLMLLVDGLEALNSEAKPSKDRTPCERQFLKNLRINHAIYIVAAKRGVHLPKMNPLDIRGMYLYYIFFGANWRKSSFSWLYASTLGMTAMVCDLQAQGDIFLGGAAREDVIDLPTSKDELASFLSGPSAKLLWNYTVRILVNIGVLYAQGVEC